MLACLPIMAGMVEPARLTAVTIIGGVIWLAGFVFESVGDAQLARFKSGPAHRGVVMDRGLWRYTRHPNYFGDACMWWGLFVMSIGSWLGLVAVISPVLMTYVPGPWDRRAADRPADGGSPGLRRVHGADQRFPPATAAPRERGRRRSRLRPSAAAQAQRPHVSACTAADLLREYEGGGRYSRPPVGRINGAKGSSSIAGTPTISARLTRARCPGAKAPE